MFSPSRLKVPVPSFVKVAFPVAIIVLMVVLPLPPIVRFIFVAAIAVVDLFSVNVPLSDLIRTAFVDNVT